VVECGDGSSCCSACAQVDAEDCAVAVLPTAQYRRAVDGTEGDSVRGGAGGQSLTPWRLVNTVASVWPSSDESVKYIPSPCWQFVINPQPKVNAVSSVFYRTLTVAISPKFVVLNQTDAALHVCQGEAVWRGHEAPVLIVLPRQEREFFWTHSKLNQFVSFSLPGYDWTGPVDLCTLDEVSVRVCRDMRVPKPPNSDVFLRISTTSHDSFGTLIVSVHRDGSTARYPMYRVENESTLPLLYRQHVESSTSTKGSVNDRAVSRIPPQQSQVFGWDCPVDALRKPVLQFRSAYHSVVHSVNLHESGSTLEVAIGAADGGCKGRVCYGVDYCLRACENLWTLGYQASEAAQLSAFSVRFFSGTLYVDRLLMIVHLHFPDVCDTFC
jgi:hypothetical protein